MLPNDSSPPDSPTSLSQLLSSTRSEDARQTPNTEVEDCSICLVPLKYDVVTTSKCGHRFHRYCALTWLISFEDGNHRRCPICRGQVVVKPQQQPIDASSSDSRLKAYLTGIRQSLSRSHRRDRSLEGFNPYLPPTITEGEINFRIERRRQRSDTAHPVPLPSVE